MSFDHNPSGPTASKNGSLRALQSSILNEAKDRCDFKKAEELFLELVHQLDIPLARHAAAIEHREYTFGEIVAFQRSIATMVRYAPNAQRAIDYFTFLMRQRTTALLDDDILQTCSINMIYVYCHAGEEYMGKAKEILELALASFAATKAEKWDDQSATEEVLKSVSMPVLKYFRLKISFDRYELQPYRPPPRSYQSTTS
ncbi:uncharacterized protein BYT42DRAFT_337365 [Radiomyces spectabilis]|uniref:uncharacterized protein n=1 Tax=Radiomyces spectabilis TaxID=64574 RepID=UPI00222013F7|nr:uncharacterized protein BYT42DRAFT_337365 [Radiomyces spectabilis]KAI8379696.1 hypothetical protein BYT42DRAFT_337365 [Radiomyces spectabilis]